MDKKICESTQVNSLNPWLDSWNEKNLTENKQEQIIKFNSQSI